MDGIKNRELYADFKKQTCLSDTIPPPQKKSKIKKPFILLSPKFFFFFFLLSSFAGILSLRYVYIFEIRIKFSIFLISNMTYFKERAIFQIFQHKNQKQIETAQNKEKCLF